MKNVYSKNNRTVTIALPPTPPVPRDEPFWVSIVGSLAVAALLLLAWSSI